MSKTVIVYTCAHADPDVSNVRFDWLGSLIYDVRPDYVVDLGDGADMRSLNSYDTRYPQSIVTQSYERDVQSYLDSQERLRHRFKKNKRKMPDWYGLQGNHEYRIDRAITHDPRLEGSTYGISLKHLELDRWFQEYVYYDNGAPGFLQLDGILYSHFIASGNYGRALEGKHHAMSLLDTLSCSVTVGHSHKFHYAVKAEARPRKTQGLVAGCFKGKEESWAGQANGHWTQGVAIKRYVEDGNYDLQWVSMRALEEEYGTQ